MTTYYVATTGNDASSGTSASPWLTFNKAATTATAGDTVNFGDGTYTWTTQTSTNSGSAGSGYIIFQATNSRAVTFQLSGDNTLINYTSESYLRFNGVIFRGNFPTTVNGFLRFSSCDHIYFYDVEVTNTDAIGVRFLGLCTSIVFDSCEIHMENTDANRSKDGIAFTTMTAGSDVTITNCTFYHNDHSAVALSDDVTATITSCTCYDNGSHGFGFGDPAGGGSVDGTVSYCDIYGAGHYTPRFDSFDKKSALWYSANGGAVLFHHNRIWGCTGPGIQAKDSLGGALRVENCTFYDNDTNSIDNGHSLGVKNETAGTSSTVSFKNNITSCGSSVTYAVYALYTAPGSLAAITFDNNLYYTTGASSKCYYNNTTYSSFTAYKAAVETDAIIDQDPLFTSTATPDLHLRANSPAINAGVVISGVTDGYSGAAPDIGAYETTGGGGVQVYMAAYARRRRSFQT